MALEASTPQQRAGFAEEGLRAGADLEPDTEFLLLRQLYLSHVDAHRFRAAADVAAQMSRLGPMKDVAHHDASRALAALGDVLGAIDEQRLAARSAPPDRRSFQYWSLATLLHFSGDPDGALGALERGLRIRLETGRPADDLDEILGELESSRSRNGYGEFVLGMLRYHMSDSRRAAVHLRAFLRRNATADTPKAVTLREELRRARLALAEIESD
jgi:tetratricopeptide (TPR) repeat protein